MPGLKVQLAGGLPIGIGSDVLGKIEKAVNAADLPDKSGQVNLKFVSDIEIAKLNQQFAGINEPTDVLSFIYEGRDEIGDIAISFETALRQAEQADSTLDDEVGTLLCHGLLHILGLDHQTEGEQKQIDSLQASIIKEANLKYRKVDWKNE